MHQCEEIHVAAILLLIRFLEIDSALSFKCGLSMGKKTELVDLVNFHTNNENGHYCVLDQSIVDCMSMAFRLQVSLKVCLPFE